MPSTKKGSVLNSRVKAGVKEINQKYHIFHSLQCGVSFTTFFFYRCLQNRQNIFPLESKKALNASAIKFSERYGNVSERFRFEIILDPIRRAFLQPGMNSSRSLIVLHYNQHLAKILKLSQWKRLVDELISMLRNRHELFGSKAKVLWKTMTAIGHKMPYYPIKGKFHTAFVSIIVIKYCIFIYYTSNSNSPIKISYFCHVRNRMIPPSIPLCD